MVCIYRMSREPLSGYVDDLWTAAGYVQPHAEEFVLPTGGMPLVIQVDNVECTRLELVGLGVTFASPPRRQFWGYGAEVLDPDGYMNHLWDEVTMRQALETRTD